MTRYLLKQAAMSLVKLLLFITLMFFIVQIVMPGDFVDQFAMFLSRAERERLRAQLGLDLPLYRQYWKWLIDVLRGDLGLSGYGFPVTRAIDLVLPPTLLVFVPGTLIAFGFGLVLGKRTAWRGPGVLSGATTFSGIALFTSFPPWLAWLVAYLFGRQASVSRGQDGGVSRLAFPHIDRLLWIGTDLRPLDVTRRMVGIITVVALVVLALSYLTKRLSRDRIRIPGWVQLLVLGAVVVGIWYAQDIELFAFDLLRSAALPLLTYILLIFGETMVIMQSTMTEVMKEEYIRAARAKGLPERVVREKHASRNALLPVLSRLFISLPYLLAGIVIIEDSVNWPGMGTMMFTSLYWQDIPVVMGVLLMIGVLALIARLFLDVLAAYMDPRIRFGEGESLARLGRFR
jgi:peptide/nickel transport system permease protein